MSEKVIIGDIKDIKLNGIVGDMIYIEVNTPIINKSNLNIKIINIDLNIQVNENSLGKLRNLDDITIPKHSDQNYQIRMKLQLDGFSGIMNVMNLLSSKKKNIHISGQVKAKAAGINKKIIVDQTIEQ
jgi:LEA14-like dessication related protein